ncbi:hypothetical protein C4D60_Mb07t27770 [Musa balbisiana]|uniref:Uncharacterized protein n=1 Tax=Musa balbisiana TaxID=52838 RepID=A0A4V4H700_MUSBA|nr:hypothetical protein C4D60_Mb07t27770 [Musa balbisiana]
MSRDPQTDPDELPAEGSFLAGSQAVHPLSDGPRADDLPATSERYWRSFDNSDLFPPEGPPSVPSPLLGRSLPETSSATACPRPHQRGLPACVVPLGLVSPKATPARPARLRRAPRPHVARGLTSAACSPTSCPSASCRPRPHQHSLPACVVSHGLKSPEVTPARLPHSHHITSDPQFPRSSRQTSSTQPS